MAFSADGRWLAVAGDVNATLWEPGASRQFVDALKGHTAAVNDVAFFPSGSRFVTASDDRSLKVWDAATARELSTLERPPGSRPRRSRSARMGCGSPPPRRPATSTLEMHQMAHVVPLMQSGCPWSEPLAGVASQCEVVRGAGLAAGVVEPANTWSNLGLHASLAWACWSTLPAATRLLHMVWVGGGGGGVTSFVYHMAWNSLFQLADFLGMYLFVSLLLLLNLIRLGRLTRRARPGTGFDAQSSAPGMAWPFTPLWGWLVRPIQLIVLFDGPGHPRAPSRDAEPRRSIAASSG